MIYRTRAGDMLDWIAWRQYGRQAGIVEQIYSATPGLADLGPVLPAGVLITLPEITEPEQTPAVDRLWD